MRDSSRTKKLILSLAVLGLLSPMVVVLLLPDAGQLELAADSPALHTPRVETPKANLPKTGPTSTAESTEGQPSQNRHPEPQETPNDREDPPTGVTNSAFAIREPGAAIGLSTPQLKVRHGEPLTIRIDLHAIEDDLLVEVEGWGVLYRFKESAEAWQRAQLSYGDALTSSILTLEESRAALFLSDPLLRGVGLLEVKAEITVRVTKTPAKDAIAERRRLGQRSRPATDEPDPLGPSPSFPFMTRTLTSNVVQVEVITPSEENRAAFEEIRREGGSLGRMFGSHNDLRSLEYVAWLDEFLKQHDRTVYAPYAMLERATARISSHHGQTYLETLSYEARSALLERIRSDFPHFPRQDLVLFRLGLLAHEHGRLRLFKYHHKAIEFFEDLLERYPSSDLTPRARKSLLSAYRHQAVKQYLGIQNSEAAKPLEDR